MFSIACDVYYFRQLALALDTIQAEMVKYYYNYKNSKEVERSQLSNLETEYFEMTTLEEIE